MTGHISDRVLDNLLEGGLSEEEELALEEHARKCARCATRLREWQILFPQIKSLIQTSEHPSPTPEPSVEEAVPFTPTPRPASLNVFVPDWSPPPSSRSAPTRLAWLVVAILAISASYLVFRRFQQREGDNGFLASDVNSSPAAGDSPGLGSGIAAPDDSARLKEVHDEFLRDSIAEALAARLHPQPDSTLTPDPPTSGGTPSTTSTVAATAGPPAPREEDPPRFPFRAGSRPTAPAGSERAPEPTTENTASQPPAPSMALPEQFTRVSLGEAISRQAGTVRLIQGMTPEAVEIAQGTILPGADPRRAVVRVVYNSPEGRLILDQQRLDRGQGEEPNIAISTSPSGVSVAQWVDRGGFWISLAGKFDQQALLAIANRIH